MDNRSALQKYFNIKPETIIDLPAINSIEYYDVIRFGNNIIDSYIDQDTSNQQELFDVLKFINSKIDSILDSNGEEASKSTKVVVFTYLYDLIYHHNCLIAHNKELCDLTGTIIHNKEYFRIVKALYRKKSPITPAELSTITNLSIQKIVSCIKKLGNAAVQVFRSPFNEKKVTYYIPPDMYKYLTEHCLYLFANYWSWY